MTKTFFVDIDGVIFKDHKINDKVIQKIKSKNDNLIFCTGRGYKRCMDVIADYITKESILIIENGSKIVDKDGHILYYKELTRADKKILDYINKDYLNYIIYSPCFTDYYVSFDKERKKYVKYIFTDYMKFYKKTIKTPFTQMVISFHNKNYRDVIYKQTNEKGMNIKKSEDYIIVNHKNVSKASAIKKYIKINNINLDNVIVVGNDYNDIEMFDLNCKNKIAVKDQYTPNELLEKADYITNFNDLWKIIDKIVD